MTKASSQPETQDPSAVPARGPAVMRGISVSPGLGMGVVHRKDHDLSQVRLTRVPLEQVESELNRFHKALAQSKTQLGELRKRLAKLVPEEQARILDTHMAYLKDSVFLTDVENLILNEQMSLEGSIAKVVADFDRIFRLVQSESLRERAVDLRDVGVRVLRNLEDRSPSPTVPERLPAEYVLVARELSIVDMFNLDGQRVVGILTEEGSVGGHAAMLARSMHIPTLTGLEGLREDVREGDFVILDAAEGLVRIRPDDVLREQYAEARLERERDADQDVHPAWLDLPLRTVDGTEVLLSAACGNLPEVERAVEIGVAEIGLYRTELLYLIDREQPSVDSLAAHYRSVLEKAGAEVTFRLLDVDSSCDLSYLHSAREGNPCLGRMGVRLLLEKEAVLRRQLAALLRAGAGHDLKLAVPKVLDCGELRRVREILFDERLGLERAGVALPKSVRIGAIIETPASVLGASYLAREADFLTVSINSLQQYLLTVDRDNAELEGYFLHLHPYVMRALIDLCRAAEEEECELSIFGMTAVQPQNISLLLGIGFRRFAIAPVNLRNLVEGVKTIDMRDAERAAEQALRSASPAELNPVLEGYGTGFRHS